ncbi:esterase-like activity of phytase family protein [Brevundimonas sp. SL130]|uniref:esterase-like activity of phytase family protein n=1 Tax=Brevundimonas sp. SL130 TaxID=2995143 RepID=UPI00226C9855|nr:esterase-like activity of phytase family protein [Brevundimonas sp. SL130]WAC60198.1 esterase-like activity of phytase family protein [Brevundimonas sp. SL130]
MNRLRRLTAVWAALALTACAATLGPPQPDLSHGDGWTFAPAELKAVGLGLPGAVLAPEVHFAGGVEIVAGMGSPLHGLSDLKLSSDGRFVAVSDAGDLVRGVLRLDPQGRLVGVDHLASRRLILENGSLIADKIDGDAEGLALTRSGDLLVSFERRHRIWNYGPLSALRAPTPVSSPDAAFPDNEGMEGLAALPRHEADGWRALGEGGGVWDCTPGGCRLVVSPPAEAPKDNDYRSTGLDRDPSGDGWFMVERRYTPPFDMRGRVRRLASDGTPGPVLVELKLPGTTDNFEGIAAERRGRTTRIYLLSDDNANPAQRTLLLAFDIR